MSDCETPLYRQKQFGSKVGGITGFDCIIIFVCDYHMGIDRLVSRWRVDAEHKIDF